MTAEERRRLIEELAARMIEREPSLRAANPLCTCVVEPHAGGVASWLCRSCYDLQQQLLEQELTNDPRWETEIVARVRARLARAS